MTATNHVVTGIAFAAVTSAFLPVWVILPAAFMLHFVLDALPHYGLPGEQNQAEALHNLRWILPVDATVAAIALLALAILRPEGWLVMVMGGILCASPDLFQIPRYLRFLKTGNPRPLDDWFSRFHAWIQWGERPWGMYVESIWLVTLLFVVMAKIAI